VKCITCIEPVRKGEWMMERTRIGLKATLLASLFALIATPAFAKSISLKDAGVTVWVFIVVGSIIVLLQLIPAAILFFSFIGTGTAVVFRGKKKAAETALASGTAASLAAKK
jgi:hypothetical protein